MVLLTSTAVLGLMLVVPTTAGAATTDQFAYSGRAFGTSVHLGNTVVSGPSSLVAIGCTSKSDIHKSNSLATVNLPPLLVSGTVRTTADTSATETSQQSQTTAEVEGLTLLGGFIKADLVKAVSTTSHDGDGFHTSADGSTFVNLAIGLNQIDASTGPNTTINVEGFGTLVLNEQISKVTRKKAALTVNMIHLYITTANVLKIPVGTEVIVSSAKSDLEGPVVAILDGHAYGTQIEVGTLLSSGPTALVSLPCLGTNGKVKTNEVLTVNLPNLLTSGTVRTTAQGTVNNSTATGETTATVEGVNLLGGLVTATLVKADAHAFKDGSGFSFSDDGSTLANVTVAGHGVFDADTAPNSKLSIDGVGVLYLHRVIRRPNSIEVRMIELLVTDPDNVYGLALNTTIRVAVAHASAH